MKIETLHRNIRPEPCLLNSLDGHERAVSQTVCCRKRYYIWVKLWQKLDAIFKNPGSGNTEMKLTQPLQIWHKLWTWFNPTFRFRKMSSYILEEFYLHILLFFFSVILLTHEGSHPGRSIRNSNPVITSSTARWCQGLFRPQVPREPPAYTAQLLSLHQHRANNQYFRTANQI